MRGFDGRRAWGYRYGVPVGAWQWSLQYQAERWDFLSQFRGEGIRLDYRGQVELSGGRLCEQIAVEDLKYGRDQLACFRTAPQ